MSQAMLYPERVERLRKRKAETGLSCQQITDMVIESGGYTSLGTVKKVFSVDAEGKKFKDITLRPIEEALGIVKDPTPYKPTPNEAFYQELIRETSQSLKQMRHTNTVKNAAIIALIAVQLVWLFIDLATPGAGWYGSEWSVNWYIKLATLLAFCAAAAAYVIIKRKRDKEASE